MNTRKISRHQKSLSAVVNELTRRGLIAIPQGRETPNTDIICYNPQKTKSVSLKVRTYNPEKSSCIVGPKAAEFFGDNFFWVLAGVPLRDSSEHLEYYIIPNKVMAENEPKFHRKWLETPGRSGRAHRDTQLRVVLLAPKDSPYYWDVLPYFDNWELIVEKLKSKILCRIEREQCQVTSQFSVLYYSTRRSSIRKSSRLLNAPKL